MIRIYTDKQTDNVIEAVDLGRVSLGETVKYTMYMKNTDIQWPVHNIRVQNVNPELRFEIPEILKANGNEVIKTCIVNDRGIHIYSQHRCL